MAWGEDLIVWGAGRELSDEGWETREMVRWEEMNENEIEIYLWRAFGRFGYQVDNLKGGHPFLFLR